MYVGCDTIIQGLSHTLQVQGDWQGWGINVMNKKPAVKHQDIAFICIYIVIGVRLFFKKITLLKEGGEKH